ncbi:MAG: HAMP domain-containing protein [Candidatus Methanofishera endochildressiae]|uniref:histidine kinase n=1 Tax=Candidatus Methanofishera endochildressiae TaxID=2738884 RepID=A0A7Z0SE82_9GAMM|nr:HAMP domain-containing protein [Candidatus Methanofishera endochildressiae]
MAKLSELGSDVLSFISQNLTLKTQSLDFDFNGEAWLGSIREMHVAEGSSYFVLMISPEKELLSSAIKIREQSLLITAVIILFTIPIVWLFAREISRPLRRLANEASLISNFDFSSPIKTGSMIAEVAELSTAMNMMKETISQFLSLIHSFGG